MGKTRPELYGKVITDEKGKDPDRRARYYYAGDLLWVQAGDAWYVYGKSPGSAGGNES